MRDLNISFINQAREKNEKRESHRGIAMLAATLLIGAILIEITAVAGITAYLRNSAGQSVRAGAEALLAARSGADDGLLQLVRNSEYTSSGYSVSLSSTIATVVVTRDQPVTGQSTITASSTAFGRIRTTEAIAGVSSKGEISVVSFKEIPD